MTVTVTRDQVLAYRVQVQQLHRSGDDGDADVLDLGVQDTGYDGAAWALAIRGARFDPADHVLAWTTRGAPHVYRRSEVAAVAAAVTPWSETDAAKRIFDAAKPLKAAGISIRDALLAIAVELRDIVSAPTVKGDVSSELTARMPEPYLRWCRPCQATHLYEQPFRLAALGAGLELEAGTSPPVLRRVPRWRGPTASVPEHLDPIRAVVHFLGPATPRLVAGFLDTTVRDVAQRWPDDVVEVDVEGERRSVLADDADLLIEPVDPGDAVSLLGNYDLFLQARDRDLIVSDPDRRAALWPVLGRPGAVLAGHEIAGLWRPRTRGGSLAVTLQRWGRWSPAVGSGVEEAAGRLAELRGLAFAGVESD